MWVVKSLWAYIICDNIPQMWGSVMIITDHYLFSLFSCDPIAREWYPCYVALPLVPIFLYVYLLLSIAIRVYKVHRQFCTYPKGHRALICSTVKVTGHYHPCPLWLYDLMIALRSVLPMFGINIQSYGLTRGSNTRLCMNIQSYGFTRSVLRQIYDIMIVLG